MTPDAEEVRRVLRQDRTAENRRAWFDTPAGRLAAQLGRKPGDDEVPTEVVEARVAEVKARYAALDYELTAEEIRSVRDQARLMRGPETTTQALHSVPRDAGDLVKLGWNVLSFTPGQRPDDGIGMRVRGPDGSVVYEGGPDMVERMRAADQEAAQRLAQVSNMPGLYPGGTGGVS